MKILHHLEPCKVNTSVALGCFDGVHRGHMDVISKTHKKRLSTVVFTFDDNPQNFFCPGKVKQIYPQDKKIKILNQLGVDQVYSIPFNLIRSFKDNEFIEEILIKVLKAKHVSCGFNYHFGLGGKSDASDLKSLCSLKNIDVDVVNPVLNSQEVISSTRIRELIKKGNLPCANRLLGRYYGYDYKVCHGKKIGRTLGIPTLNQVLPQKFITPKLGVYASIASFNNFTTLGITYISVRGNHTLSETWMPYYFGKDLYHKNVEINLIKFIRERLCFKKIDHFKHRLILDKTLAHNIIFRLPGFNDTFL